MMMLACNFAGIEELSHFNKRIFKQDFDKARLKERSRRNQAFKAGKHDFKYKDGFL